MEIVYTSQSRLGFDTDMLVRMGVKRAYVTPFNKNNECLSQPEVILANLQELADKAKAASKKGLEVYPFFVTINHPEGNYEVPGRYRRQRNLDGSDRPTFICFRDAVRQEEMIRFAAKTAELGFARMGFDDDLRDAFCYCDEHLNGFAGFCDKTREEVAAILNGVLDRPEDEQLRVDWYRYKYEGMTDYAARLERAVHEVNPACRIGICNSAKRCQDFSGRIPAEWLKLFDSEDGPAFVRLCGECYDDNLLHLAQSTGWHGYFNNCYRDGIERKLEVTSVPTISYRSPGTVQLETKALVAATAVKTVHWAWPEEFVKTGLVAAAGAIRDELTNIAKQSGGGVKSSLALYVDHKLGAYTPPNICSTYGASHDPMTAYNVTVLVGVPIEVLPAIPADQEAVMCSAYISREMIVAIDNYVKAGGVAILDAVAGQCYRVYGGQAAFDIEGPAALNCYEVAPDGSRDTMVADYPPEMVYLIKCKSEIICWTSFGVDDNIKGVTTAVLPHGKGHLIVMGYDLSRSGSLLVLPDWRERLLAMMGCCGVTPAAYWDGPAAVQCFYYGDKVALVNYNSNDVAGEVVTSKKRLSVNKLNAMGFRFIDL